MAKSQPTHEVFAVTDRGRGKRAYWQKIGAAWAHEDGKGLAIRLDYMPLNGQGIVAREPLPGKGDADDDADAQNTGSTERNNDIDL